jgi:hypothetical protein
MWILVVSYCTVFYCDSYIVKRKFPTEEACLAKIEEFMEKNRNAPPNTISFNTVECWWTETSPELEKEISK